MFTGIIAEIGKVKKISRKGLEARLEVEFSKTGEALAIGDSVAVNGVCLTLTAKGKTLTFDAVGNTLKNTNLKRLKVGDEVNLESALKLGDTVSGHMVSGHIDAERAIKQSRKTPNGWVIDIGITPGDQKYLVSKGSVAIDGVSLTVGELSSGYLRVFLIPHTLGVTTLDSKRAGDMVNIEFDMTAKYVEKQTKSTLTANMLKENGFI